MDRDVNGAAWTDGMRWVLVVAFAASSSLKFQEIRTGTEAWHPIFIKRTYLRRHATSLTVLSLLIDVVALVLLIAYPQGGAILAIGLIIAYTGLAFNPRLRSDSDGDCRCFWRVLNTRTGAGLVARNLVLVTFAIVLATDSSGAGLSFEGSLLGVAGVLLLTFFGRVIDSLAIGRSTIGRDGLGESGEFRVSEGGGKTG